MQQEQRSAGFLQRGWIVGGLAIFCNLLWGSAFPGIKVGYSLLHVAPYDTVAQILFAGSRFFLAGIMVILVGSLMQRKFLHPKKDEVGKVIQISLVQTVLQYLFFYVGLAHTTAVKGSVLVATNVFFCIMLTGFVFKTEQVSRQKLLGCLIGFAGVVLINLGGGGVSLSINVFGDICIVLTALSSAFSSVLLKKYGQNVNPVMLSGYQFMWGGAFMAVVGLVFGGRLENVSFAGAGILLYLAFLSAAAYTIWSILLKYNPVSKVTIFGFFNPVFGVILSTLILREGGSFGIQGMLALLLVCIGIIIVNLEKK